MTISLYGFFKTVVTFVLIAATIVMAVTFVVFETDLSGNFFHLVRPTAVDSSSSSSSSSRHLHVAFSRDQIAIFKSFEKAWGRKASDIDEEAFNKKYKSLLSEATSQGVLQSWTDRHKQSPLSLSFHLIIGIVVQSREQYAFLQSTWAQQLSALDTVRIEYVFFSSVILDDPRVEIIGDPSSPWTISSMIEKMQNECIRCQWLMIVQDTTMVYLPSLVKRLDMENASVKQVFGFPVAARMKKMIPGMNTPSFRYADRRAGYVFSRKVVKSLASSGARDCAKKLRIKRKQPGEIGFFSCLLSNMNIQVSNYHGLNPTHPDVIINDLIQGKRSIANLYGDGDTMNVFAMPLTHGDITNATVFRQFYEGYYRPPELPRQIHQIWIGSHPRQRIVEAIDHCRETSSAARWQHRLWGQSEIREELGQEFLDLFPGYNTNSNTLLQLTDTARLFLIYRYGGVYLDADSHCLRSFEDLVPIVSGYQFFISRESERHNKLLANGIMGGVPRSQTMQLQLYRLFESFNEPGYKGGAAWTTTGPSFVTYNLHMFRSFVNVIILPSHTFIPIHFNDLKTKRMPSDERVPYAQYKGSFTLQYFASTINEND